MALRENYRPASVILNVLYRNWSNLLLYIPMKWDPNRKLGAAPIRYCNVLLLRPRYRKIESLRIWKVNRSEWIVNCTLKRIVEFTLGNSANNGRLVRIENDTPDLTELSWSNFTLMNIDGTFLSMKKTLSRAWRRKRKREEERGREEKKEHILTSTSRFNKCRRQYREVEQLRSRILYIVYALERALRGSARFVIMSVF